MLNTNGICHNKFTKMDYFHMTTAWVLSQNSSCASKKVGSLIVKDDRIISTGYNGTKKGYMNCCDHAREMNWLIGFEGQEYLESKNRLLHSEWSDLYEYHAEQNAIDMALRQGTSINGASLFVNLSPCVQCCKRITNANISRVVYSIEYDRSDSRWKEYLEEFGVEVDRLSLEDLKENNVGDFVNFDNLVWDLVI